MIESVEIKTTLKAGTNVWVKGVVVKAPLHPDLLREVKDRTGNVKVLTESAPVINVVPKVNAPITSVSVHMTDNDLKEGDVPKAAREGTEPKEKAPKVSKRKPKLVRRK